MGTETLPTNPSRRLEPTQLTYLEDRSQPIIVYKSFYITTYLQSTNSRLYPMRTDLTDTIK